MNTAGPVLRDIHVPSAPWWPLAPGWWLAMAAVLLLAAGLAWWFGRRGRNRLARAASREIDALAAAFARDRDPEALVAGSSRLLRRLAMQLDRRAAAADGEAWSGFLRRHGRDPQALEVLERLARARFRPRAEIEPASLLAALRSWTRDATRSRRRRVSRPPLARGDAAAGARTG